MIRRLIVILTFALLLVSCGPSRYTVHVEMRHPSKTGLDLAGKIVSVVYYSGKDSLENEAAENMAMGFAEVIEKDNGTGDGSVGVYSVERSAGNYTLKDSLVNLVIQTDGDVVFLLDATIADNLTPEGTPVKVELYCYDGLGKEDVVKKFIGNSIIPSLSSEGLGADALIAGKHVAESFKAQWKHEQYSIAYYDSLRWYEALERADHYDWKGAMDIWFEFLESHDALKRAAAEYNIAVACYMLGDFVLAQQWLDKSVAENDMPTLTEAMRKRIEARKK